jgi:hypothetical protein
MKISQALESAQNGRSDIFILKAGECELDIPHYYTNVAGLKDLLKGFQIIRMRQIEDIWEENSSWHYFVNLKKV